jgi:hypothetical protein
MTERQRILDVFNGKKPDRIPYVLDLSHFYNAKCKRPFHLLNSFPKADYELIDYHKKLGVGFYMPNQAMFYDISYGKDVKSSAKTEMVNGVAEIHWEYETPFGKIERIRRWEPSSYSWPVKMTGVQTQNDLKVLGYAMGSRIFSPRIENYLDWKHYVGNDGVVYLSVGYSAIGYLLNYWMGIENTLYASFDMNLRMHETVERINENGLQLLEMAARDYPCEVILMNDEFDSSIQSPAFFSEWSREYYTKAIMIAHKYGKKVSIIYNGRLRGTLSMLCSCGPDAISAITPFPMGDLTPKECRSEAGRDVILSGGVTPDLWYNYVPIDLFKKACMDWIALSKINSAVIADASNQVPPGAEECRIEIYKDLIETYGQY